MARVLYLGLERRFFLCFEYPRVMSTTANMFMMGCSTKYKRCNVVFITSANPKSNHKEKRLDVKYNKNAINSCVWVAMSVNNAD